jgi:hypothetical protein
LAEADAHPPLKTDKDYTIWVEPDQMKQPHPRTVQPKAAKPQPHGIVKKCRRNTPVLSASPERCVILAKAGIQCRGCGAARVFWIPAFAGMTPFWYFVTSPMDVSNKQAEYTQGSLPAPRNGSQTDQNRNPVIK